MHVTTLYEAFTAFLYGLCFGVGFAVAQNVVKMIGALFH